MQGYCITVPHYSSCMPGKSRSRWTKIKMVILNSTTLRNTHKTPRDMSIVVHYGIIDSMIIVLSTELLYHCMMETALRGVLKMVAFF